MLMYTVSNDDIGRKGRMGRKIPRRHSCQLHPSAARALFGGKVRPTGPLLNPHFTTPHTPKQHPIVAAPTARIRDFMT
jgi:hypothetical protein